MEKEIKVVWCENFIKKFFQKHDCHGVEVNCFWSEAEKSGLWIRGTYNSSMTKALEKLVDVETVHNESGDFLYDVFRLK